MYACNQPLPCYAESSILREKVGTPIALAYYLWCAALLLAAARTQIVAGRPSQAADGVGFGQCLTQRRRTRSTKGAEGKPRLPRKGRGAEDKEERDARHPGRPLQNTLRLK